MHERLPRYRVTDTEIHVVITDSKRGASVDNAADTMLEFSRRPNS